MTVLGFAPRAVALAFTASLVACDHATPYRIGIALDRLGTEGATLAANKVNAQGGINGHPLELSNVEGAGGTNARLALRTAERLAADPGILAVVGHTNSGTSLTASQVYNARHVLQIAPTATAALYGRAGPYSMRLVASDVHQASYLADHVLAIRPRPRVAVMFVNNDYGRPLHGMVVERLRAGGVTPAYDAPFDGADMRSGADLLASLIRARPTLLIWIGRDAAFTQLSQGLRDSLPALTVFASDGFGGERVPKDTLHRYDAVQYVRLVNIERADTALQRVRAAVRRAGHGELSDQAVLSHDAVMLLAEAIRAAGPKREAIRDWVARIGRDLPAFPGLSGPIAFEADGDRAPQYFLVRADRKEEFE
ncbi:MAG: branched-chain amino acid ABC transporter substrate-binding protein [bacterium]